MVNKSKSKGSNKTGGKSKIKKQKTPKSASPPPPHHDDGVEAGESSPPNNTTTKQVLTEVQQNGEINGNNIPQVYHALTPYLSLNHPHSSDKQQHKHT